MIKFVQYSTNVGYFVKNEHTYYNYSYILNGKDDTEKPTNREIRERALLELCRKFKPLQTRAIQTALKIMENEQGADQNRLKAAVFLSQTYRQLLIDTFNKDYDEDEGEEIQQGPKAPVFSLTMINSPEDNK